MIENLKILAIIPARGGSKGLKNKNIALINGVPLIAYSIEAAKRSKYVDFCVVSSDCRSILEVASIHHSETLNRPDELATDTASSECVVQHAISCFPDFDLILLLQPTSPLRTSDDVDSSIELLIRSDATAVISVYEPKHTPFKCFKITESGFLSGLVDNQTPFMRRQDLPAAFMPNGAIYLIYRDDFLRHQSFFTEKTIPYNMPIESSTDIDTQEDLDSVAKTLHSNISPQKKSRP